MNCNSENAAVLTNCCVLTHSLPHSAQSPRACWDAWTDSILPLGTMQRKCHRPGWCLMQWRACIDVIEYNSDQQGALLAICFYGLINYPIFIYFFTLERGKRKEQQFQFHPLQKIYFPHADKVKPIRHYLALKWFTGKINTDRGSFSMLSALYFW